MDHGGHKKDRKRACCLQPCGARSSTSNMPLPSSDFILTHYRLLPQLFPFFCSCTVSFPLTEGLHKFLLVHFPLLFPPATSFPFPFLPLKAALRLFPPSHLQLLKPWERPALLQHFAPTNQAELVLVQICQKHVLLIWGAGAVSMQRWDTFSAVCKEAQSI